MTALEVFKWRILFGAGIAFTEDGISLYGEPTIKLERFLRVLISDGKPRSGDRYSILFRTQSVEVANVIAQLTTWTATAPHPTRKTWDNFPRAYGHCFIGCYHSAGKPEHMKVTVYATLSRVQWALCLAKTTTSLILYNAAYRILNLKNAGPDVVKLILCFIFVIE
jgi:hypothetical protein